MQIDFDNLKALSFRRDFKAVLTEALDAQLNGGSVVDLLPERLEESDKGKTNKANFIKEVDAYESDFKDAATDPDPEIKGRGKEALAALKKVRGLNEAKFANGVPRQYSGYLSSLFAYVAFMQPVMPTLKEEIETGVSAEYLDELFEGFDPKDVDSLMEYVRSDEIAIDWSVMNDDEKKAVTRLKEMGRMYGSDQGAYAYGVLRLTFTNKQSVIDFTNDLEDEASVDTFELEVVTDEEFKNADFEDTELDFDTLDIGKTAQVDVYVYLDPYMVSEAPEELDVDEDFDYDDENVEYISEVKRRIKVNFRGKKRIKMQCRKGFKWDAGRRSCIKITGAAVALKRRAMRQMVRTKKAKGASFKTRVLRKTRKAKRFRKSMGLK